MRERERERERETGRKMKEGGMDSRVRGGNKKIIARDIKKR